MLYLNKQKINFIEFPNKEKRLDIDEAILKNDNTVIFKFETNDNIFELFLLDDVLNRCNKKYKLIIPYLPYSRMDRIEKSNTAFSLNVLAKMLSSLNPTKLYILDPHSNKSLELLKQYCNYPVFEYNYSIHKDILNTVDLHNSWIVFPDKGAFNRYSVDNYPNVIICNKERDFETGKITNITANIYKQTDNNIENLYILDDLCSYGGTFIKALNTVLEIDKNVRNKNLVITHCEDSILKGEVLNSFDYIFTTDSIATLDNIEKIKQSKIIDIIGD